MDTANSEVSAPSAERIPPAAELIRMEALDDIPVLFATVQRLQLAHWLDQHFRNHEHHLWKGELTVGEVVSVWLTFLLSQGDHRLNYLQPWVAQHHSTLQ